MLSVFHDKFKIATYAILWLLYALVHIYIYSAFTSFSFVTLITDAGAYTLLYAVTGVLLMYIIKYAGFDNLNVFQRNLNYFGLFLFAIIIVVGIAYVIVMIISDDGTVEILQTLLPLRVFISSLIFCLLVSIYKLKLSVQKDELNEEPNYSQSEEMPLKDYSSDPKDFIDRIAIKSGQKINVIPVDEIYCLKAESDYVQVITEKGKYLKEQTMKYFEENLLPIKFVRVHRSYIVNVDAISRIELYEKQTQLVTLKNGMQIRMSQSGYKLLKNILKL
jgi:hypothetical protein